MYKVYTEYYGTSEIEHGLCACTVDNPLTKAQGLSLHTGAQTMLYLAFIYQCAGRPVTQIRMITNDNFGMIFLIHKKKNKKKKKLFTTFKSASQKTPLDTAYFLTWSKILSYLPVVTHVRDIHLMTRKLKRTKILISAQKNMF